MGLKYYLNFFKKDSNAEAVKLRYYLNIFVFLVYMVFFAAFFSLRNANVIASSVFGMLALIAIIIQNILRKSFIRLIDRFIANESLSEEDKIDAAFIAYRKGYAEFKEKNKSFERKFYFANIISAALIIAILPVTIILNLMGNIALADRIFSITTIVMLAYLIIIIVLSAVLGRKGIWYQNYFNELAIINKYKSANSDIAIKYKILEDKKPNKQLEYLFPKIDLRNKFKALQKAILIVVLIFFLVIIAAAATLPNIIQTFSDNEKLFGIVTGSVFGGVVALWIMSLIIISVLQSNTIKKQYLLLKENEAEYALYIKLHELRTSFIKRWNILFPLCFFGEIVAYVIFTGVAYVITNSDSYGVIFFLLLLIEFIATFVLYFKSFGKIRLKMSVIENEIDMAKIENTNQNISIIEPENELPG